jgi:hypothetical protein
MIPYTQMTLLIWNKVIYDLSKEFSITIHAQNLCSASLVGRFSGDS